MIQTQKDTTEQNKLKPPNLNKILQTEPRENNKYQRRRTLFKMSPANKSPPPENDMD